MALVATVIDQSLRHDVAKEALGIICEISAVGVVFEEDLGFQAVSADIAHGYTGGSIARVIPGRFSNWTGNSLKS